MRHRRRGRVLGRSPSHRKALYKNLASALFLTERDADLDDNAPKVKGRIITTLPKAKEIRPLVEKCITIAKKSLPSAEQAQQFATSSERGSDEYKQWRKSDQWQKWAAARSGVVTAQRRCLRLLGDKQAVAILFSKIAPAFADRPGGYTRILKLAKPRLGDAGQRAILEFVGENDRVKLISQRPAFVDDSDEDQPQQDSSGTEVAQAGETAPNDGDEQQESTQPQTTGSATNP